MQFLPPWSWCPETPHRTWCLYKSQPGFSVRPEDEQTTHRSKTNEHVEELLDEVINVESNKQNRAKKTKTKRGNKKNKEKYLNIFSTNAAQLK